MRRNSSKDKEPPWRRLWRLVWHYRLPIGALLMAVIVVAAGILFLPGPSSGPSGKYVAVYFTDIPGGFERLQVVVAGVTVGQKGHPLNVETPEVELSSLHGPSEALKVASGWVPLEADGQVAVVFASARGYKDGEWASLEVPHSRLVLEQGLPPGQHKSNAALFDFSLETSLVQRETLISFEPYVQEVTQVTNNDHRVFDESKNFNFDVDANLTIDVDVDLDQILKVDVPPQYLDDLARQIVDGLCERFPGCIAPPGGEECLDLLVSCTSDSSSSSSPTESCTVPLLPVCGGGSGQTSQPCTAGSTSCETSGDSSSTSQSIITDPPCAFDDSKCRSSSTSSTSSSSSSSTSSSSSSSTTSSTTTTTTTIPPAENQPPDLPQLVAPASGSTKLTLSPTLSWTGGDPDGEAVTYEVVINGVVKCTGFSASCAPSGLAWDTAYSWTVRATDGEASRTGGPWTFTTNRYPNQAGSPSPASGAQDQPPEAVTVSWSGSDPDGAGGILYKVWTVDTNNQPTTLWCNWQSSTSCTFTNLAPNSVYRWRVDTKDEQGLTREGPVWNFQTDQGGGSANPYCVGETCLT